MLYKSLHIALANIELTVLGQVDGPVVVSVIKSAAWSRIDLPVFSLDLACVFKYPDIDEQISRWLQATSEVDVGPLSFVRC